MTDPARYIRRMASRGTILQRALDRRKAALAAERALLEDRISDPRREGVYGGRIKPLIEEE